MADSEHYSTAQQKLDDFRPHVLSDRHERQQTLLSATGCLGEPPYDVLDLGGGSGVTAVWAARKGWPVTIVDIDRDNLSVLTSYLGEHEADLPIRVMAEDVTNVTLPRCAFDVAYLKDLIEHVEDYEACLRVAYDALRPGGLMYIATTNVWCPLQLEYHGVGPYSWYPKWLQDRIRRYAMSRKPSIVGHTPYPAVHWFSRRSLTSDLERSGFSRIWSIYDLVTQPRDLTRRTRLVYPLVRHAKAVPFGPAMVDLLLPGLTIVAQR